MNKFKLSIVVLFITQFCISQVFDDEVEKVIQAVSQQLNSNDKKLTIAIYPFKYKKENEDVLAEYITDEFWDKMPNTANTFSLMDRSTFEEYYREHNLRTEGLIDPSTEKQFGMLIAANAYITGKTYVFNSVINLKVKVTDTETGEILATGSKKLPITYDMAEYMGLQGWKNKQRESEKGKSSNPDCALKKLGDMCFQNTTKNTLYIRIEGLGTLPSDFRNISVDPKKFGCFKDLPVKGFYYSISLDAYNAGGIRMDGGKSGNFYVKKCQSDLIKI